MVTPKVICNGRTDSPLIPWPSLAVLGGLIAAASAAYALASWLRFEEFFAGNWDLGINMQLLWTNTHGYLLYEAGDYESARANSFLFVHPTYIAIPISYLYELSPTAGVLFGLQSVVFASSIIPLYLIGRQSNVPARLLYAGLGIYLASLPVLAGILFDFHWEAFIPAEFLWTYYLWNRGRYWWAALPATLGLLTLEVFPVLLVGLVAYFAIPLVSAFRASTSRNLRTLWMALRGPALPLVGLLGLAATGYVVLSLVSHHLLPSVTGIGPSFSPPGPNSLLGITWWGISADDVGARLLYWFFLFAAFGFLPLLYRQRLLVLSAPWAIYTVLMTPNFAFTRFGYQYSLIAVGPIAIGFIEGLGLLTLATSSDLRHRIRSPGWFLLLVPVLVVSLTSSVMIITAGPEGQWLGFACGGTLFAGCLVLTGVIPRPRWKRRRVPIFQLTKRKSGELARVALISSVVLLVGSNIALSPLDPSNFLGRGEGGYSFTYTPNPSYPYMSALIERIPADASVVASNNLFPFVANDPRAYSLFWYHATPQQFPFDDSHPPMYVLLSTSQWFVPGFLDKMLYDPSAFGLVEMLYSSIWYPGSIYLFQLGYSGTTDVVQVNPFPAKTILCGSDFALGPAGAVVPSTGTPCGAIVESRQASQVVANGAAIWYGPYITLLPGNYAVTISLEGFVGGQGTGNEAILVLNANALGTDYWFDSVVRASELSTTHWTNFTYRFQLSEPHPDAEWRGYLEQLTVNGQIIPENVQLNFIEIDYTPADA